MAFAWLTYIMAFYWFSKEPKLDIELKSYDKIQQYSYSSIGYGLWIAFLSRLMMDYLLLSAPLVLLHSWNWSAQSVGSFLALSYLLVFCAQMYLANYSVNSEEVRLIILGLGIMGIGSSMISSL